MDYRRKFSQYRPWSALDPLDEATVTYSKFDNNNFHTALSTNRLLRAVLE